MNPRRFFYPAILYVNVLTVILCMIGTVGPLLRGPDDLLMRTTNYIVLLALGIALFYVLRGARKKDFRYLRSFLLVCALTEAVCLADCLCLGDAFLCVLMGVRLLCYLTLAFKHNLGRDYSLILSLIIVLAAILGLVAVLITNPGLLLGGSMFGTFEVFRTASMLELSIISLICTWYKYQDKEERKRALIS